ncbi:MAG: acetyl-CoA carboxylase biotin carboxyl carrier protein [Spirochaetes bacterium]|nr:acetyl-CoA carboxylase biotin carboxyl carrier protein [Spirochaetota bacterium]MCK5267279.1 acetyl-CoA carboxylase biotin carboxyl carrier protein [Spirochaetota bacterium]
MSGEKIYKISSSDIEGYANFFEKNNLEELVVEEKGTKIHFKKTGINVPVQHVIAQPSTIVNSVHSPVDQTSSKPKPAAPAAKPEEDSSKFHKIISPLNGSFYTSPSPDDPVFIKAGDSVSPDTTVCIVEAMKSMNELKAEISGKVIKILCKNEDSIKEGQELIWIERS